MILYNFTAAKIVNFFYSKPDNVVSYSSKLLEDAVNELSRLPGIGKRTALRLALHLMKEDIPDVEALGNAVIRLRTELNFCKNCHNISDEEYCNICSSPKRDKGIICVIEDIRDIMAIENTGQFNGVYHVLGGIISPIEGIAPHDLNIDSLIKKLENNSIDEVILALPTTIEGDTTNFYLFKKINPAGIKISVIARGIAIGDDLEFADEITLGRSIINRVPYADKA